MSFVWLFWPEYCDYTYKPLRVALASVLLQLMQVTCGIDGTCVHERHASPSVKFCLFCSVENGAYLVGKGMKWTPAECIAKY